MATPAPAVFVETKRSGQDFLVALCGLATSAATAFILFLIEKWTGFALYSWSFWFVVPVGAIFAGFGGASGYYFGARYFGHRPSRTMFFNIVIVSVTTFFLIHYLTYSTLVVEGKQVSDYISFWRFLDLDIRSTSIDFRYRGAVELGTTPTLGVFGYVYAAVQIAGFALGGILVDAHLRNVPYCEACSTYMVKTFDDKRYTSDSESLAAFHAKTLDHLQNERFPEAFAEFNGFGEIKAKDAHTLRAHLIVRKCKECGRQWMKSALEKKGQKNEWKELPEFTAAGLITGKMPV